MRSTSDGWRRPRAGVVQFTAPGPDQPHELLVTGARHVAAAAVAASSASDRVHASWRSYLEAVETGGDPRGLRTDLDDALAEYAYAWAVLHCTRRDAADTDSGTDLGAR